MIIGEDEHLCLAGEATEGGCVQNAVPVALETRAQCIGFLGSTAGARTDRARGIRGKKIVFVVLAFVARHQPLCARGRVRVGVCEANTRRRVGERMSRHGGGPHLGAARGVGGGWRTAHKRDDR